MVKLWSPLSQKTTRLNENVFRMKPKWDKKGMIVKMSWSFDQEGRSCYKMLKTL